MNLIQQLEQTTTVTKYDAIVKKVTEAKTMLLVKDIALSESTVTLPASKVYEQAIAKAYRKTRDMIGDQLPYGKKQALAATLQARKLLHMPPQILKGGMDDIKALAIKNWNESYSTELEKALLDEKFGIPSEEAEKTMIAYLNGHPPVEMKDQELIDKVTEFGHQTRRHIINTASAKWVIIKYSYEGSNYVRVETPQQKFRMYKAG